MFIKKIYSGQDAGMGIIKDVNISKTESLPSGQGSPLPSPGGGRCDTHQGILRTEERLSALWEGWSTEGRIHSRWGNLSFRNEKQVLWAPD